MAASVGHHVPADEIARREEFAKAVHETFYGTFHSMGLGIEGVCVLKTRLQCTSAVSLTLVRRCPGSLWRLAQVC